MSRIARILAHVAAGLFAATLIGQPPAQTTPGFDYVPLGVPGVIYTPEIKLGSATQPSVVTVPPIEEVVPSPAPYVSNAPPASTALLSTRNFDFIVSPEDIIPGSMEDTSISLGTYARELRAEKQNSPLPNAIAIPPPESAPSTPQPNCK